jgi:adhesin/invasin
MHQLLTRGYSRALALALASLVAVAACSDNAPPVPSALVALSETSLSGVVGEAIATPLSVKVTDAKGKNAGGIAVTFAVAEGGGTLSVASATTDGSGTATTSWRLGERAGTQRVTASVAGVSTQVTFVADARPGAAASMAANGGNNQSVVVGTATLTAPSVIVRDKFTNPVPGVSIVFTVASGGGTIAANGAVTNSAGIASAGEWRLGSTVGANTLTALALAGGVTGNPVTFTAQATPGAPARITAVGSTSLSGVVFRSVATVPQVRVTDAGGNAVTGASVTFTASTGSAVSGATKSTDASGLASPDAWQLGTAAGDYTLTAAVAGAPSVTFTATARADAPSIVAVVAGANQSAPVGRPVAIEPSVRVTDIHRNPVAGVEVLFEVASGDGSAVGRRPVTNALGIATVGGWTLGDAVGANTLVASVPGTAAASVTFTATGTAGTASSMVVSAGQNQTAAAGTAVAIPPAVLVRDARGNPVANVEVVFSVGSGGGTITAETVRSNSAGIAAVGSWVLGGAVGTQTLIARSGTLSDVTFTATATAGAAARLSAFSSQVQTGIVAGTALSASQRPAIRVTDEAGNPVSGTTVTFTVESDGSSGYLATSTLTYTATAVTNVNGIATVGAWVLPTTAGVTATATASISGITETVTFTVQTTPGAVTRLQITSGGSGALTTTAGAVASTITISARDANNNVVTTYGGAKSLLFNGPSAAPSGTVPTVDGVNIGSALSATFVNGVATAALQVFRAQSVVLSVTDGTYSSGTGGLSVAVTAAAAASAATSTFTVSTTTPAQSSTSTVVTVTVKDVYGNVRTNAADSEFTAAVTAGTAVAGSLSAFTCASGVCTANYTAPGAAGTNTVSVKIGGVDIVSVPSPILITIP